MRASELIGRRVVDRAGRPVGVVVVLLADQDGPLLGLHATFRVHTLVVGRHRTGSLLGYGPGHPQRGPWLVATAVHLLHRRRHLVPWSAVADRGDPLRLRVDMADVPVETVW
jgi:hypothetical protein